MEPITIGNDIFWILPEGPYIQAKNWKGQCICDPSRDDELWNSIIELQNNFKEGNYVIAIIQFHGEIIM